MVSLVVVCLVSSFLSAGLAQNAPPVTSLSTLLDTLVSFVDTDRDGQVSMGEMLTGLYNTDFNRDGCVDVNEWENGFVGLNFTREYARFYFNSSFSNYVRPRDRCLVIDTVPFQPTLTSNYRSYLVAELVKFCESNPALYISNRDCSQLSRMCSLPSQGCLYACYDFSLNIAPKRNQFLGPPLVSEYVQSMTLEQALDNLVNSNDQNQDGLVTPAEIAIDLGLYDVSNNGITDLTEFKARWMFVRCGGLGLSEEFAEQRFADLAAMTGGGQGISGGSISFDFPTTMFINMNLDSLVKACEVDRRRYKGVKDCRQLLDVCLYTKYGAYQACQNYINGVIKGRYGYHY